MENDVFIFPAVGLAECPRHNHEEDIAVAVVFGLHLREATQNENVANLERHGLDGFLGSLGASPGDTCDKRERLCRVVGARRLQEEVHVLKHLAKGIAAAVEGHRPKGIHGATRRRERLLLLPRNDIKWGTPVAG